MAENQAAPGRAADFFVATEGNDHWSGRQPAPTAAGTDGPFATIGRARDAVRELKQGGLKRDVTVLVRGGTYRLAEPIVLGPEASATPDHTITYAAYPSERPVLSGGRPIAGWQEGTGGVWTTTVEAVKRGQWSFRQLFVNGERRRRARHPNDGYLRVVRPGSDNRTAFTFHKGDLRAWDNLGDVEIVFLHDWSVSRVRMAAVDEKTGVVRLADRIGSESPHFRITAFEPHPRYYVENARDLLDAPGEWHLDRRSGVLSYRPMPGEAMDRAEVVAPVLDRLLVVAGDGTAGRFVEGVRFVGLTFAHCRGLAGGRRYAGAQAGFHERAPGTTRRRMPAAVRFEAVRRCAFENGAIEHVGGTAISLAGHCSDNRLVGSAIRDAGGNGVMVGTTDRNDTKGLARRNVVANNLIRRCGVAYHGCVAVWVGITEGTVVAHNEISHHPYTGVSVGWQWNTSPTPCRGNVIEDNHIHHVMQVLSDGGGIYTLGRQPGTVLRGNVIHDVPVNAGRAESNGMFIDEGSSEILIENNTIYAVARSPIRFHRATADTVRTNVLVCGTGVPPFRYNRTDAATITRENNTVVEGATPPASVKAALARAGLERPHRERLLTPP